MNEMNPVRFSCLWCCAINTRLPAGLHSEQSCLDVIEYKQAMESVLQSKQIVLTVFWSSNFGL